MIPKWQTNYKNIKMWKVQVWKKALLIYVNGRQKKVGMSVNIRKTGPKQQLKEAIHQRDITKWMSNNSVSKYINTDRIKGRNREIHNHS